MNITLNAEELEKAVLDYVNKLGVTTEGKRVSVYINKDFSNAHASISIYEDKNND